MAPGRPRPCGSWPPSRSRTGRATLGGFDVIQQAHEVRQLIAPTGLYAADDENLTGVANLVIIGWLLDQLRKEAWMRAERLLQRFDPGRGR